MPASSATRENAIAMPDNITRASRGRNRPGGDDRAIRCRVLPAPHPRHVDELPRARHVAARGLRSARARWRRGSARACGAALPASVTRCEAMPKLSPRRTKSGLARSEPMQPVAVQRLLHVAHVAVGAVVEHDHHHRDAVAHRARELLHVEHEAAVAGDRDDRHIAERVLGAERGRRRPSRACPGSRRRCRCAARAPRRPSARCSRPASAHRGTRRCRAARRGSRAGKRSAAPAPSFRISLRRAACGWRASRSARIGESFRRCSVRRASTRAEWPTRPISGLRRRSISAGSTSTLMIFSLSSTPQAEIGICKRVPTASTTSAVFHNLWPPGSDLRERVTLVEHALAAPVGLRPAR